MEIKSFFVVPENVAQQIHELQQQCQAHDGAPAKVYWHLITTSRSTPGNYCVYEKGELVAYLTGLIFSEGEVEITGMVAPSYRQKGLFTQLVSLLKKELQQYEMETLVLNLPQNVKASKALAAHWRATYRSTEYALTRDSAELEPVPNKPMVTIRRTTIQDVNLLASVDSLCFNTDFTTMQYRFIEMANNPKRQSWLCYKQDELIGKVHARRDKNRVYLHEICVLPQHQRKGYGTEMVKLAINDLIKQGQTHLFLEVEADNEHAIHIYQRCGFSVTHIDDYWTLPFELEAI